MKSWNKRDKKRRLFYSHFEEDRLILTSLLREESLSTLDRLSFRIDLFKLPRDTSHTRIRRRCFQTYRSRGVCSKLGISRLKFRESIFHIPGIRKY